MRLRATTVALIAIVVGLVVGLLVRDGKSSASRVSTQPSVTTTVVAPTPPTLSERSQAGAVARNHAFVLEMFANQPMWPIGYRLTSYTGSVASFDNLSLMMQSGIQSWMVAHLVFRWRDGRWVEVANIPATPLGGAVPNGQLEQFEPFSR